MKKMSDRSVCAWAALGTVVLLSVVGAQSPEPRPAFQGQTDAPRPAKPSSPIAVQTVAGGLTGAWAFAFLPDGSLLVTQNSGTMRVVRSNGVVSAPLAGLPPVKSVAAQGLHDVVLDLQVGPDLIWLHARTDIGGLEVALLVRLQ